MKDLIKVLILLALAIIGMMSCTRADGDVGLASKTHPQLLVNDAFQTRLNEPLLLKVLANDWLGLNGTMVLRQPAHGEINITAAGLVYQPTKDFKGADQFYYYYTSKAGSDSARVEIKVQN